MNHRHKQGHAHKHSSITRDWENDIVPPLSTSYAALYSSVFLIPPLKFVSGSGIGNCSASPSISFCPKTSTCEYLLSQVIGLALNSNRWSTINTKPSPRISSQILYHVPEPGRASRDRILEISRPQTAILFPGFDASHPERHQEWSLCLQFRAVPWPCVLPAYLTVARVVSVQQHHLLCLQLLCSHTLLFMRSFAILLHTRLCSATFLSSFTSLLFKSIFP